ncbi:MAG TPA: DUF3500 domain-containing protein [Caulobacterales bacterium]|nr:DUF3500 domain-containing protein [Caulobacterales bacterium]
MSNQFRDLVPAPDHPRVRGLAARDAYSHADRMMESPRGKDFVAWRLARLAEPFVGVTADGRRREGLFPRAEEGAPVAAMEAAARALLAGASAEEAALIRHPLDAPEWRAWSNPELYINRHGLRLDAHGARLREAVLALVRASLSAQGFAKARGCMRINHFLGALVNAPRVMNEYSYNFLLFGEPSLTEPWGWNLYGHHLALNCFVWGGQMVISPVFMGAEPNAVDSGPDAGLTLFDDQERAGLALMRSLAPPLQARAQVYKLMKDPAMPPGRWHPADQRHLGGAFQDNRVIPYEGVTGAQLGPPQRAGLLALTEAFLDYLPDGPRRARMSEIERHLDETHFCWIGATGDEDPFYYRIQSPVVMVEFDHHSGVFLTNAEPAKCHIHTIVRTPNGNDYGKDLLRAHYEKVHPGLRPGGLAA